MSIITAPYAEIAPTVAALKALTPEERCPNHCLFVPPLGSWVYYSPTTTTAANNTTIFEPNDGLGRWILAQPAPSGGSSGGSVTQQPGIDPAAATLTDLQRAVNQILSTLTAAGITGAITYSRNYDSANPTNDLTNLLGTNGGTVAYANPHPSKILASASSTQQGATANLFNRIADYWHSNNTAGQWLSIDIAVDNASRKINLSGIGLQNMPQAGNTLVNAAIEGSNDGTSWTLIHQWNAVGFTAASQWKYTTFSPSAAYRYIRIRSTSADSSGQNFFGLSEINLYGALSSL